MTHTYLMDVIKALSPAERQELLPFLASPFFNRGAGAKELTALYRFILAAEPDFHPHRLEKEKAYAQVYSGQPFVPGKLEKLMAELNKQLRAFALVRRQLDPSSEHQQHLDWSVWLRERGLVERAHQVMIKLKKQKEKETVESLESYRFQFQIAEEEHVWELFVNQMKGDVKIPELILQLDLYYQNYRTELENRYLLQQKGAQLPDFETLNKGFDDLQSQSILLQLSRSVNRVLKNDAPSVEEFQHLLQLLQRHEAVLPFQTIAEFNAYLRSACTMLINSGFLQFSTILHEIHQDNLNRGLFFINGQISPHAYMNLVQIAVRAKEVDWAKHFTEQYKDRIIGGDEDLFYYRFNLTHCLFAVGDFEDALSQIAVMPTSSHYHHIIRRLEVKIYYELGSELLEYKLEAFRKFVERTATKTITANLRKMDLNFFNIMNQLTQTTRKNKKRATLLVERIEQKKLLSDRAWLLEKARELG